MGIRLLSSFTGGCFSGSLGNVLILPFVPILFHGKGMPMMDEHGRPVFTG
jgi:hypothetical protein